MNGSLNPSNKIFIYESLLSKNSDTGPIRAEILRNSPAQFVMEYCSSGSTTSSSVSSTVNTAAQCITSIIVPPTQVGITEMRTITVHLAQGLFIQEMLNRGKTVWMHIQSTQNTVYLRPIIKVNPASATEYKIDTAELHVLSSLLTKWLDAKDTTKPATSLSTSQGPTTSVSKIKAYISKSMSADNVDAKKVLEAASMLNSMVEVLKPNCSGTYSPATDKSLVDADVLVIIPPIDQEYDFPEECNVGPGQQAQIKAFLVDRARHSYKDIYILDQVEYTCGVDSMRLRRLCDMRSADEYERNPKTCTAIVEAKYGDDSVSILDMLAYRYAQKYGTAPMPATPPTYIEEAVTSTKPDTAILDYPADVYDEVFKQIVEDECDKCDEDVISTQVVKVKPTLAVVLL